MAPGSHSGKSKGAAGAAAGGDVADDFTAMRWTGEALSLIDQRCLPHKESWLDCRDLDSVAVAIENMTVRGAPAIGCAAAYALALDARRAVADRVAGCGAYRPRYAAGIARLARTRPTAVNLFHALDMMTAELAACADGVAMDEVATRLAAAAQRYFELDLATCRAIGRHGATHLTARITHRTRLRVLTHCNAGGLATAGYGTAVGVLRALKAMGRIERVYADETRPWLQGARLTAFELAKGGFDYRLIADSAAAWLMARGEVDAVVVGADRIAANGDTANKIGTYGLAVQCRHHGVPFFVAAPLTTIDVQTDSGLTIPVEERPAAEVRHAGGTLVSPADAPVWNPSFDVTPAALISAIITEKGVLEPAYRPAIAALGLAPRT